MENFDFILKTSLCLTGISGTMAMKSTCLSITARSFNLNACAAESGVQRRAGDGFLGTEWDSCQDKTENRVRILNLR
jgi:hypothetical protein